MTNTNQTETVPSVESCEHATSDAIVRMAFPETLDNSRLFRVTPKAADAFFASERRLALLELNAKASTIRMAEVIGMGGLRIGPNTYVFASFAGEWCIALKRA